MALAIKISNDSGAGVTAYMLKASSLKIQHARSPIAIPMPGTDPILLDLGQWKLNITVTGDTDFTGHDENDGAIAIADRDDLEYILNPTSTNSWHDQVITLTDDTNSGATTYTVKISGLTLEKADAKDYYTFTLAMVGFLD